MKSFFNKKINLILTIILIALIIYNLFNRPLIEGNSTKIDAESLFINTDNVPSDGQTVKVSGSKSSKNKAHNMGIIMTQLGATHQNAVGLNSKNN